MNLVFKLTDTPIMKMQLDLVAKTAKVTYISNELAVAPILETQDRGYLGLEQRLQELMQIKKPLPELLEIIKQDGIHVAYHNNLNISIDTGGDE